MIRVRQMWGWLGTPGSQKAIALLMVMYLGALGALTYGQNRIVTCQAKYAEKSAKSTQARAALASQDRLLDNRERTINNADREDAARAEMALDKVLVAAAEAPGTQRVQDAFAALLKIRAEVAKNRQAHAEERKQIAETRADNEEERSRNPVPDPPSSRC